jgi:hypothetical protein
MLICTENIIFSATNGTTQGRRKRRKKIQGPKGVLNKKLDAGMDEQGRDACTSELLDRRSQSSQAKRENGCGDASRL